MASDFEELSELFAEWAKRNSHDLNQNKKHLDFLYNSVIALEKETGGRFCPCRLRMGGKKDLELLCPCNFEIQDTWKKNDRCWCGLFFKKGKGGRGNE